MTLREVKRLTAQASSHANGTCQGCVDLTIAMNILIGLVEGHRHRLYDNAQNPWTGPMQAMEER